MYNIYLSMYKHNELSEWPVRGWSSSIFVCACGLHIFYIFFFSFISIKCYAHIMSTDKIPTNKMSTDKMHVPPCMQNT